MVAALVPMVPEGLILMTSIAFAVGVVRLGQRQCLVNELPAIEGLARVDVVCADKTGTLTENALRLAEVRLLGDGDATARATALGRARRRRPTAQRQPQAIAEAYPDNPGWAVEAVAPFSSARKWSGASFAGQALGARRTGRAAARRGDRAAPSAPSRASARAGCGCCCSAAAELPVDAPGAPGTVDPAALVVLEQKIRPDAKETLDYFAEQDVTVKVISGDNAALGRGRRGVAGPARRRRAGGRPDAARGPGAAGRRGRGRAPCSAGSRPGRSARWSARCRRAGTRSR